MHIVVRFREHRMGGWVFAIQKVIDRSIAVIPTPFLVAPEPRLPQPLPRRH